MSKSDGNTLTLSDSVIKYSADGTRLCLADAGDSVKTHSLEFLKVDYFYSLTR